MRPVAGQLRQLNGPLTPTVAHLVEYVAVPAARGAGTDHLGAGTVASAIMEGIPLAAEDRAILALEYTTVAGHTCKVILIGGEPDLAALRS